MLVEGGTRCHDSLLRHASCGCFHLDPAVRWRPCAGRFTPRRWPRRRLAGSSPKDPIGCYRLERGLRAHHMEGFDENS